MYQWLLLVLCFLAVFKYVRLILNCIGYWRIRPKPILDNPTFTNSDATVIIPSLLDGDEQSFKNTIRSILKNDPHELILITIDAKLDKAKRIASEFSKRIKVDSVHQANKRRQMIKGLALVETEITIFADDDVLWRPTVMPWMLAPFEDPEMGGVGTNQRLRYQKDPPGWLDFNFWEFLGAAYLIRRNWDCAACTWWDGSLPCLSGRTVAYRTEIVSSEEFKHEFEHETWRTFQLNADDDNFLTRWMVNHGYKTWIQYHSDCEVLTTLEDNPKYVKQCFRWARSNWRSNLKSLFKEWTVWRRHLYSTFAVFLTTLTSWALVSDTLRIWLCWYVTEDLPRPTRLISRSLIIFWVVFFCRLVKYIGHFRRYPTDLKWLLIIPIVGYIHSCVIKPYALFTLKVTTWGSREGADANDDYRMIRLPDYEAAGPSQENSRFNYDIEEDLVSDSSPLLHDLLPPYDPSSTKEPVVLDPSSKHSQRARGILSPFLHEFFPYGYKSSYATKWIFRSRMDLQRHDVSPS